MIFTSPLTMIIMIIMGGLEIIIIVLIMMRIGVDNGGEIGWIGRGRRKLLRSPTGFQPNRCELGPTTALLRLPPPPSRIHSVDYLHHHHHNHHHHHQIRSNWSAADMSCPVCLDSATGTLVSFSRSFFIFPLTIA